MNGDIINTKQPSTTFVKVSESLNTSPFNHTNSGLKNLLSNSTNINKVMPDSAPYLKIITSEDRRKFKQNKTLSISKIKAMSN